MQFPIFHLAVTSDRNEAPTMATRVVVNEGPKSRRHPMMQTTLPIDMDESEIVLSSDERETSTSEEHTKTAPVKKRVFSAPSLNRSFAKGAERIPALGRSSSATASATASRIVSRMAPMLRRVVSGSVSKNSSGNDDDVPSQHRGIRGRSTAKISTGADDAPASSPRLGHNFLDSSSDEEDEEENKRDSLLFMIQIPTVDRKSHIPLMSFSHPEE